MSNILDSKICSRNTSALIGKEDMKENRNVLALVCMCELKGRSREQKEVCLMRIRLVLATIVHAYLHVSRITE